MRKTYSELQKELLSKTKSEEKIKDRARTLKVEVLEHREREKSLILQYERLVREWRKRYEELLNNGWKLLLIKVKLFIDKKRGV